MNRDAFASSDSVRTNGPLRHAQYVTLDEPLELELGGVLPRVTVAYETYGTLADARDNVVLICHAISGDSHVARHDANDEPGWWDIMVGPGKPVDTNRYYVICPNILGGCRGTTGPGSINPETGMPYGSDFPTITIRDMVEVQRRLLDHLGIERLLAVVGGSIGGHQALSWNVHYPERVQGTVLLATSPRLNSQALAFDVVGRNAILRDPHFHGGQYYDKPEGPIVGLALARMIGHITYLSREAMTRKFEADRLKPREVATEFEKTFSVGSYLGYQAMRFVERFDANSYVTLSLAMDLFDLGATPEQLAATLARTRSRWLVLSFSSDWLFPPEQSRDIVDALVANAAPVSYCNVQSTCGHDAFLLPDDLETYGEMTRAFLRNLESAGKGEQPTGSSGAEALPPERRLVYDRIAELIPPSASVLDLGCGTGRLLARLKQNGSRRLVGIELDEEKVLGAVRRDLDVIHADLNKGLGPFRDREFDCVVLSQTLQAVENVQGVIADMLRVGRTCIVSFPNLAYHPLRRKLAEEGRAPRAYGWLRDRWYDTRDIRFFSIADFEDFCRDKGVRIDRRIALNTERGVEVTDDPNLKADLAIFVISSPVPGREG
ncbi:MAG TPA: homoserine O-acetyltransferase [Verrucomicrobia bacterium]|nr:homoserine O-acetyltransferase [Verrucomicrobiota bacterium]